jgi:LmbE family N-acetylglucosaminyl deacetylase
MPAVVASARARGWIPPATGFWSLTPEAFGIAAEPPTLVLDVGAWVPRKLAALRAHRSQMGIGHPFAEIADVDARRWLGVEHFHRAPIATPGPSVLERL